MTLVRFILAMWLIVAAAVPVSAKSVTFLPVDEAYDMSFYLDGPEFVIDWIIVPDYYLYKDKFIYSVVPESAANADGIPYTTEQVVTDVQYLETWEEKYDPTFDEIMNIYHAAMSVRLMLADMPRQFDMKVTYQGCADAGLCYPPQKVRFHIDQDARTVNIVQPQSASAAMSLPTKAIGSNSQTGIALPMALVLALLGGLILNLMPCVFPVLSIKALSMVQTIHDKKAGRQQGLWYGLGVVLGFLVIGLLPVLFRSTGNWLGWGFQLQSPVMIGLLTLLFFVLALNLSGWFQIGGRWMGMGQSLTEKPGVQGSFFTGILATLVATPCIAPFMGTAIAFALSQPAWVSLLVFGTMGVGMALPLTLLAWFPQWGRKLPKPGPWMDRFKQALAFPLYITAIWLLSVLDIMKGGNTLLLAGVALVLVAIATWSALSVTDQDSSVTRSVKWTARILLWALALGMLLKPTPPDDAWQAYDPDLVSDYVDTGVPVFIDVTAAWCITCKVNEKIALSSDAFFALAASKNIQLVKADWTNPSPEVDALVSTYGQSGVPLYVLFANGKIEVLPQILTPELMRKTFSKV